MKPLPPQVVCVRLHLELQLADRPLLLPPLPPPLPLLPLPLPHGQLLPANLGLQVTRRRHEPPDPFCANTSILQEFIVTPFFSSYFPRLSNLNLTDNNLNNLSPLDLSRFNFNPSVKADTK